MKKGRKEEKRLKERSNERSKKERKIVKNSLNKKR